MRAAVLQTPGGALGAYPERSGERAARRRALDAKLIPLGPLQARQETRFVAAVVEQEAELSKLREAAFVAHVRELRGELHASGFDDRIMAQALAVVREASRRTLGKAHFPTQILAARIMLSGRLAEMATGEGKTLAAALVAGAAALSGIPVHVITANDYLVARDAQMLQPVYSMLGLKVGWVTQPMDQARRREAYNCDITYCTAKELVFDYLRDRLVRRTLPSALHAMVQHMDTDTSRPSRLLLRGLWMALIDEADSILIDEARTPLILSQPRVNAQQQRYLKEALQIAIRLVAAADFHVEAAKQTVTLTDRGRANAEQLAQKYGGLWQDRRHREEVITFALIAHYIYTRDRDYIVRDRKILMVDQTTGRVAEGRMWSKGLHQLIEVKEGCPPTGETETIAQITYQRFFPRYLHLAGMSGTLTEARAELEKVYGMKVAQVPLRCPSKRLNYGQRLFVRREDKWQAVTDRILTLRQAGRPVLIGTDSVADSDQLSMRLAAASIEHQLLNARQDKEEAELVACAGESGRVTVATNMAGRGTDIPLGPGVAERGGLHVICCQHNSSARIDRQLHGRAARQGDPGSVETVLCLEDGLLVRRLPGWLRAIVVHLAGRRGIVPRRIARLLTWLPQQAEERAQRAERRLLLAQDKQSEERLSFAGRGE